MPGGLDYPTLNRFNSAPLQHIAQHARIAQLVEQRIENPRVGGSIPPPGTIKNSDKTRLVRVLLFLEHCSPSLEPSVLMPFRDIFEDIQQALLKQPRIAHFEHLAPVVIGTKRCVLETVQIVQRVPRYPF